MKNLKKYNTIRIGAVSEYYVKVNNVEELIAILNFVRENGLKFFILGNGSNVLFKENFYEKFIVIDMKGMNNIKLIEGKLICNAGVLCKDLINFCIKNRVSGLEFLAGIPGTIGGFVKMNAGAFGKEIKDVLNSTVLLDVQDYKVIKKSKNELKFQYRSLDNIKNKIIITAEFNVKKERYENILKRVKKNIFIRKNKQPKGYSFGSVFKNGENYFAGELIEKAGLKGFITGDVAISEKHANFIINKKDATGRDVLKLIEKIEKEVKNRFNIELEREVEVV